MISIKITGTGSYLPPIVAANSDYADIVDTSSEWILTRTGIEERRLSSGEPTWYMAQKAAEQALMSADTDPGELDGIIFATISGDYTTPSMSCVLQGKLGAKNALTIDINCACAGLVYAIDIAYRYLLSGFNKILVVGSENLTKLADYSDRASCILFGDGAGACVLEKSEGIYSSQLGSAGDDGTAIFARSQPPQNVFMTKGSLNEYDRLPLGNKHYITMDGKEIYKWATRIVPETVRGVCQKAGIDKSEIDWLVLHQANMRILEAAMKNLDLPMSKTYTNLQKYGNTSGASIGICLDEMNREGLFKSGQKICLVGFGAGLIYAGVLFEWGRDN